MAECECGRWHHCEGCFEKMCKWCGETPIDNRSTYCKPCSNMMYNEKDWPPIKELELMVKETSCNATAKRLGVSFHAVKKHIKKEHGEVR